MVGIEVKHLLSWDEKSKGLVGAICAYPVFFTTRWGIHTFLMKFPIDVLILNNKDRVVCAKKQLKPNRIYAWNPIFNKVLELPTGTIKDLSIKIGDSVHLSFKNPAH